MKTHSLHALTLVLILCFLSKTKAQDADAKALQSYASFISKLVVPPSPEAASLGKYGNNDVNFQTGAMNLSIPITNIGGRDIQLPIGLSYDGSGNRVEQIPSMMGLGWALSAGGVITRSAKGNPDKNFNYFSKANSITQSPIPIPNSNPPAFDPFVEYDHMYDITKGVIETQPDDYFFNFGGMSGKFHISPYGTVYMRKQQDLVITPSISADVDDFVIKDSRGNKYYFTAVETTHLVLDDAYGVIQSVSLTYDYKSSWYLTKVESANGTEVIELTYDTETGTYTAPINSYQYESVTYKQCGTNAPTTESFSNGSINTNQVNNRRFISKIVYKLGTDVIQTLKFETAASTYPYATGRQLNKIKVYNSIEGEMATTEFVFTYDGSTNRLTLKSVQEQSMINANVKKNAHTFVYNSTPLPAPTSNSIDHWGYYNGASNTSLIPSYTVCNGATYAGGNANRETDPNTVKAGVMTRINYPTGGYTDFDYEAHKTVGANLCSPTAESYVGGLRLKSSMNYDANGQLVTSKTYNYTQQGSSVTSGVLNNAISYSSNSSFTSYAGQCLSTGCETSDITCSSFTLGTSNHAPLGVDDGSHIRYTRVEEINPSAGKTVYNYTGEDLTKKEVFNETGTLVSESFYEYTSDSRNKNWFGYTAKADQNQDNRTEFVLSSKTGCTGQTVTPVYFWKLPSGDTRLYLNACPYTTYQKQKNYKTKFTRLGYLLPCEWKQQSKVTEKLYFNGDLANPLITVTELAFANKNISQPTQTLTTNSDNVVHKVKNYFAHDLQGDAAHPSVSAMITNNLIGVPLRTEIYQGSQITNAQEMVYATSFTNNQLLPKYIRSRLKNGTWETQFTVDTYNSVGLPTQTTAKGFSLSTYYTWTKNMLLTKTFGTTTPYMLTSSYTYGAYNMVETVTDENGLMKKFTFDPLLRLSIVQDRFQKDANNNLINVQATTTYNYHYKGQPVSLPNDVNDLNQNFVSTSTTFINGTNSTPLSTKQYMDGLGRPMEVVKEYYTPNILHQKNYVGYDALGRQNKSYLPFESNNLGFEAASTVASVHPFVLTEYEASPLSRPVKQTNVDGSTVLTSYGGNTATEVRNITNITSSNAAFYALNTLSKTTMTDENGKQTCVFKDKLGRVVLTRKFLSGQNVDTYNVYDDYGQLVAVLPPGSVDGSGNVTQSLIFKYTYDNKNRLVEKKVPGADPQKFFYNSTDQLVLTQDGNMAHESPVKYLATIYDVLGRVVKTGFSTSVSPTQGQDITVTESQITELLTQIEYYPNKSWVKHQGAKVLKPAGTTTLREFVWSYIERREGYTYTGNPIWTGKQHLLAETYNYDTGIDNTDRPIDDNDNTGVDWSVSAYDGAQKPTATYRYLFSNGDQTVKTYNTFEYDNGQRLINTGLNYGLAGAAPNYSGPATNLSNMNYNFKDQLIEKNIGFNGSTALQSIDYSYNLRGWLTYINGLNVYGNNNSIYTPSSIGASPIQNLMVSPLVRQAMQDMAAPYKSAQAMELPPINDTNTDLFSEKIDYSSPDSRTGATAQYNGNISAVAWQVAGRDKQTYGFKYDDLDRLTEANYFDLTDVNTGGTWNSTYSTDNKFKEKVSYDLRGNITYLQRNGMKAGTWTGNGYTAGSYGMIDDLTYNYNAQNQVIRINDMAVNPNGPRGDKDLKGFVYDFAVGATFNDYYTYDYNGNLKTDAHKDITGITYNYLNLPQVITFSGGRTITFVYDAMGTKLQKITNDNGTKITYNYVNGVEYKDDVLQRIAHTEGAVVRNDFGAYDQEYVLRDHLGNVRVTFKDGINKGDPYYNWYTWELINPNVGNTGYNDGVITANDITQINHYYPFGLNMEGNWNGSFPDAKNKYGFNEKELNTDFGLNWNDYGARFYDPAIARWHTIDPLTEKYTDISPYAFTLNNPLRFADPNGKVIIVVISNGGGNEELTYKDNKLFTVSGAEYTPEANSFAETVLNALNTTQEKSETAKSLTEELQSSSFEFKIEKSDNVTQFQTKDDKDSKTEGKGAGGTVSWNPNSKTAEGVPVQGQTALQRNPTMNLIHELLGHGTDSNRGTRNDNNTKNGDGKGAIVLKPTEKWASHVENQIRVETNNKLRTKYDYFEIITPNTSSSVYYQGKDANTGQSVPYEYKKGSPILSPVPKKP